MEWIANNASHGRGRKFILDCASQEGLNGSLRADTTLGDYDKPFLAITATEIEKSQIRVFSPLTQAKDRYLKLVDVVMASAALPGVFPDYPVLDPEIGKFRHLCGWLPLGQRAVACCCRANHTEWEGVLTRHSRCQYRDYRSTLFDCQQISKKNPSCGWGHDPFAYGAKDSATANTSTLTCGLSGFHTMARGPTWFSGIFSR